MSLKPPISYVYFAKQCSNYFFFHFHMSANDYIQLVNAVYRRLFLANGLKNVCLARKRAFIRIGSKRPLKREGDVICKSLPASPHTITHYFKGKLSKWDVWASMMPQISLLDCLPFLLWFYSQKVCHQIAAKIWAFSAKILLACHNWLWYLPRATITDTVTQYMQ
jgi:hypothetical protein